MSGHSHFATIKRQKAANDAIKGKVFSKHSKSIAIAIKEGGSADPEMNSRLRFVIEQAKADNMPKSNIDRVLQRASEVGNIEEITYEGFGPEGVGIIVRVATDNKNRTSQEIKGIFDRGGGNLAGPGAVSFNFEPKGLIVVKKGPDKDTQILSLIDMGVEDIEEGAGAIEAYVDPNNLSLVKDQVASKGFETQSFSLVLKPRNYVVVQNPQKVKKIMDLVDLFEEHNDVQDVYTNLDIPDETVQQLGN